LLSSSGKNRVQTEDIGYALHHAGLSSSGVWGKIARLV